MSPASSCSTLLSSCLPAGLQSLYLQLTHSHTHGSIHYVHVDSRLTGRTLWTKYPPPTVQSSFKAHARVLSRPITSQNTGHTDARSTNEIPPTTPNSMYLFGRFVHVWRLLLLHNIRTILFCTRFYTTHQNKIPTSTHTNNPGRKPNYLAQH